jgi:hypothetical protein
MARNKDHNPPGGEHDDGTSVLLASSGDTGKGDSLTSLGWPCSHVPQAIEQWRVADSGLGKEGGLSHHGDGLDGVVALGGLSGKHDTIGTVEDGIGNVGNLSTGRSGVVLTWGKTRTVLVMDPSSSIHALLGTHSHRLQHLGGTDRRLAGDGALGDHHLLSHEDLGGRDLDTKITSSNHDTVSLPQDLVKVDDTLLVLNLDDNLDPGAIWTENLSNLLDVVGGSDERSKDHVNTVLDTESKILLVLFRECGKIHSGLGEVDTLAR